MKRSLILLLALLTLLPWQPIKDRKKRTKTVQTDTIVIVDTVWMETEVPALPLREQPRSDTWRTIRDDSMVILESMSVNLDSLLHDWHSRKYLLYDSLCVGSGVNPDFPDSVYRKRLDNLPTIVPMVYNQPVRAVIDRYATRSRALVSYMLGVMQFYSPVIEQALDFYQVPQELKYLLERDKARARIEKQDADTYEYYKHFVGHDWKDPNGYHITINSSQFGYEGTAEIIDHIVRHNYIAVPKVKVRELRKKYNLEK